MTDATQSSGGLTPEVIDVFARGLYHLANVDGIDAREERLIQEFLEETGSDLTLEALKGSAFSPVEAAMVLETSHIRRVFVKAAVAMVRADGVYSDAERHAIGELADAFDMSNAEFGDIEQEAARVSLD
ncbi:MAG: TerB family tellurite resistance protein [Myxococcales bacterium]|nr:TerB family tellurite resistance protein [Myxococcales bacterium]MCB9718391.1 TerB family tellurite resistance protein [Myxococcales bacterium]